MKLNENLNRRTRRLKECIMITIENQKIHPGNIFKEKFQNFNFTASNNESLKMQKIKSCNLQNAKKKKNYRHSKEN